jgi:hypothetical protein
MLCMWSSRDRVRQEAILPELTLAILWLHRNTDTVNAIEPMVFLVPALTGVIE